jgi:uncharacterized phage protein (TIGR02220 family)
MDWSNERYVRVYTRDSEDLLVMSWEARALLWELHRKCDRAGVIETRMGSRGLSAVTRIPADVVAAALPELLDGDGAPLVVHPKGYLIRNFIEAQETPQSDAHRARESRARRRDEYLDSNAVTFRDANVTSGHAQSHAVTSSHAASLLPSVPSDPCLPSKPTEIPPYPPSGGSSGPVSSRKRKARPGSPTELEKSAAVEVLQALSRYSGVAYRGSENHVVLIVRQLRAGRTGLDLRKVAWYCAVKREWKDDEKMRDYLRPETLFGPKNIDKYLDAALTRYREEYKTDEDVRQRDPPQAGELRVVRDNDFETGDAA